MASDHTTTKLNPDSHLLLDQPLLRLPHELIRRNFKNTQRYVDREREQILPALKDVANAAMAAQQTPDQTISKLDAMIARMQTFKRKLENLRAEEESLHDHTAKRLRHIQNLYDVPSLIDPKFESWSRTRLDRLIVDYLLRSGYSDTALCLAEAKKITHLIDLDTFTACHKIVESLYRGETKEALTWVNENRSALKKLSIPAQPSASGGLPSQSPNLEFELRFQQLIEIIRTSTEQRKLEAIEHVKKYIIPYTATRQEDVMRVAGLLAQSPDTVTQPYSTYFRPERWEQLAELFIVTHHALLSLPNRSLLHTALSAGLSALKTPACHSVHNPASSSTAEHPRLASNTSLCPICSTELNDLARSVPYAHHTVSYVDADAVVLPNNRVYGRSQLEDLQRKILRANGGKSMGGGESEDLMTIDEDMVGQSGRVTDPITSETFLWKDVKKVYIT